MREDTKESLEGDARRATAEGRCCLGLRHLSCGSGESVWDRKQLPS